MPSNNTFISILRKKLAWPFIVAFLLEAFQTNYLNVIAVVAMLAWVLFLCRNDLIDITVKSIKFPNLLLFELWGASSLMWSLLPSTSIKIILNEIAFLGLAILISYNLVVNNKAIGDSLKFAASVMISLVFLYSILFYGSSFDGADFSSFFLNKNGLGFTVGICFLIMLFTKKESLIDYVLTLTSFVLLILSQSKTSINFVFLVVALLSISKIIQLWFSNLQEFTQGFLLLITKAIPYVLYIVFVLMVFYRDALVNYLTQIIADDLFTGRGMLWNELLLRSRDNLLTGFGPGVFWGAGTESEIAQTQLYFYSPEWVQTLLSADGGYIDVIGSLGFIGLALLLFSFVQIYQLLFRLRHHRDATLIFALLTFFVLHNITESHPYRFRDALWFLYLTLYFYLSFLYGNYVLNKQQVLHHSNQS